MCGGATTCVVKRPNQPASALPPASIPMSDPSGIVTSPEEVDPLSLSITNPEKGIQEQREVKSSLWSTQHLSLPHTVVFFSCAESPGGMGQASTGPPPQSTCLNLMPASGEAVGKGSRAPKLDTRLNLLPACPFVKCHTPGPVIIA